MLAARDALARLEGAQVARSHDVVLRGAQHPLLDRAAAVPIDLELGALRALVVSGPNTGGKTVALKTLGLAAVLHQCGLRPPADEAALPVFDEILADIGDEQSIAMSLSTFSAHVRNLVAIIERATERSLVLLDELAAGTDPVEGAALAQAVLARLSGHARLTVATSHYAELKEWASAAEAAANAATGLDPETNEPLYTLALGRPGTSHALRRPSGSASPPPSSPPPATRSRPSACGWRSSSRRRRRRRCVPRAPCDRGGGAARGTGGARRGRAPRAGAPGGDRGGARVCCGGAGAGARGRPRRSCAMSAPSSTTLRAEIRAARRLERQRGRASTPAASEKERQRDRRLGAAADRATRAQRALSRLDEPVQTSAPLAPGDPVVAPDVGVRGTIAEIMGGEATVLGSGGLRVKVPLDRLQPSREPASPPGGEGPAVTVRAMVQNDLPDELDLRGRTAQDAREAVRDLVDPAALAGRREVRVIHGRGTGAVRKAVRDELARHPLVEEQVSDSADGATVVRLGGV